MLQKTESFKNALLFGFDHRKTLAEHKGIFTRVWVHLEDIPNVSLSAYRETESGLTNFSHGPLTNS